MCVPRWLYNALLSVMTMRRILATAAALCLGGCITVYGPVKTGGQQQQDSQAGQQPGMSEQISTSFIGNRKPDELLNAVALYFREKAITASVNDQTTGIIAGIRHVYDRGVDDSGRCGADAGTKTQNVRNEADR